MPQIASEIFYFRRHQSAQRWPRMRFLPICRTRPSSGRGSAAQKRCGARPATSRRVWDQAV